MATAATAIVAAPATRPPAVATATLRTAISRSERLLIACVPVASGTADARRIGESLGAPTTSVASASVIHVVCDVLCGVKLSLCCVMGNRMGTLCNWLHQVLKSTGV